MLIGLIIGLIASYFIILFWAYFLHRIATIKHDGKIGKGTFKQFKSRFDLIKWEPDEYYDKSCVNAVDYQKYERIGRICESKIIFNEYCMLLNPFAYFHARLYVIYKIYEIKKLNKIKIPKWEELEAEEIFNKLTN